MPKGLKSSSSLIVIGAQVQESGANTFTEERIDLQLNPLDNEVFVVQAINLNVTPPDAVAATNTSTTASVTTTSQTALGQLQQSTTLATSRDDIRAAGFVDGGCAFARQSLETPPTAMDYIGIISTNDFFLQVQGSGNLGAKFAEVKMYGYRARADASTYAALVQSEVLSA